MTGATPPAHLEAIGRRVRREPVPVGSPWPHITAVCSLPLLWALVGLVPALLVIGVGWWAWKTFTVHLRPSENERRVLERLR